VQKSSGFGVLQSEHRHVVSVYFRHFCTSEA
jgi:hypothetical protein